MKLQLQSCSFEEEFRITALVCMIVVPSLFFYDTFFVEPTARYETTAPEHNLSLWYTEPAYDWMSSALPIGNGQLGAMIFGGIWQEHIQFNEKTIWTGDKNSFGAYQNFGDMFIDFPHVLTLKNYQRELDLEDAISRVEYQVGDTYYNRVYFCSYPDNVLVCRFTSSENQKISFDLALIDAHSGTISNNDNSITFSGKLDLISYRGEILVKNEGGEIKAGENNSISVKNANAVTILLAGGSNYNASNSNYLGTGLSERISGIINDASKKTYEELKKTHLDDYRALFSRVSLDLNHEKPSISTPELIKRYNQDYQDPALEVLYFQFGRYLAIASSRGIGLPSNLQGIWNHVNNPPWQSDYHTDINLQMNYWPTDITNLGECFEPFSDYIYNQAIIQDTWKNNANNIGFSLNTQCNPFGNSGAFRNSEANAWFCLNLWDHYDFTGDEEYLNNTAYPVMKSACEFWLNNLINDTDGTLIAPNSWSPENENENGFRDNGTTYAQTLIWHLFKNTIKTIQILDEDNIFGEILNETLEKLDPGLRVGDYGQLQEWKHYNDIQGDHHRHISHLIGLYPGNQISPLLNTTFSDAAEISLLDRGDGGTGWSTAWKINCWARLYDGNHAKSLIEQALWITEETGTKYGNGGGIYYNLLDAHPPFQIDGNFGTTAGIAELLLQSHLDMLHILPALPDDWSTGSVKGLVARGAFDVNITWDDAQLIDLSIESKKGNPVKIKSADFLDSTNIEVRKLADNSTVEFSIIDDVISFNTLANESYKISIRGEIN